MNDFISALLISFLPFILLPIWLIPFSDVLRVNGIIPAVLPILFCYLFVFCAVSLIIGTKK